MRHVFFKTAIRHSHNPTWSVIFTDWESNDNEYLFEDYITNVRFMFNSILNKEENDHEINENQKKPLNCT